MTYKVGNLKSDMEIWAEQLDKEITTARKMVEEGNRALAHVRGKRLALEGVLKSIERVDVTAVPPFAVANMVDVLLTALMGKEPSCAADLAKILKLDENITVTQTYINELLTTYMDMESCLKVEARETQAGKQVLYYYLDE